MTLNRRIRDVVNSQLETKSRTVNLNLINPYLANPYTETLPRVAQGAGLDQRTGNEIFLKGIDIWITFTNVSPAGIAQLRATVMAIHDAAVPQLPAVPTDAVPNDLPFTVKVVRQSTLFPANIVGIGRDAVYQFKYTHRFPGNGRRVQFAPGTATPVQGGYALDVTANLAVAEVIGNGYTRVWYKDA